MSRGPGRAYEELIRRVREARLLRSCAAVLQWDQQTYMPARGGPHRAQQLALLAGLIHEQSTAPVIGELLGEVEGSELAGQGPSEVAANIREIRRGYDRACRLPRPLVTELTHTCTLAREVWVQARKDSDFALFRPWLEKIVALKQEEAKAVGYAGVPYDALLDDYEPGETTAHLAALFSALRDELVPLVAAIQSSTRRPDVSILQREYRVDRQVALGRAAAAMIGFDFTAGRLDETTHPFCSGIGPGDTRLTTRYNSRHFGDAFFSILHEAGHGIYDQGLDPAHSGTPLGAPVSLAIHESQSRLWENLVGRSRAFWEHVFPRVRQAFPEVLEDVGLDALYFAINDCRPSFIRVDADEVTYNLHILLRFELEQALISGELQGADVPAAWNEGFKRYFEMEPPDDAQGCLQDTHWSSGAFGYFPTYTLGNLYAAQFFAQASADLGGLDAQFRRGEFAPLKEWLNTKIHRQGQRYRAADLIVEITGRPLSHKHFIGYLHAKFSTLYGV